MTCSNRQHDQRIRGDRAAAQRGWQAGRLKPCSGQSASTLWAVDTNPGVGEGREIDETYTVMQPGARMRSATGERDRGPTNAARADDGDEAIFGEPVRQCLDGV